MTPPFRSQGPRFVKTGHQGLRIGNMNKLVIIILHFLERFINKNYGSDSYECKIFST